MAPESFWNRRFASFRFAFRGIAVLFRGEIHAWFHLVATIAVLVAAIAFSVTAAEAGLLILACGLVWTAEAVNTAVELTVDLISPDYHDLAGRAKDVAAGAVLLASLTAACIGVLVFAPRLF
ncbi:MAG: diacylglycerol kinase family protein [Fuerstiella sp.]